MSCHCGCLFCTPGLPSTSEQIQLLQIALGGRFEGEDLPPPAAPERSQQPQPQAGVRRPHVPVQPQFSSLQRGGGGRIHYPSFNFLLFGTSFTNIRQPTRRIQLARSPSYRQACPRRPTARTTATTTATTRVPPSPSGAWQIVMERMGPGPERSPAPVANSDTRARPDSARGNPRDIALVLDASGSIGSANYKRAVENVATLMGMLCYQWPELDEPSDVRLALVVYSSHVQTVFDFAMSREMHTNSSAIRDSILKARGSWPCMGASTATGPALRRCYDEIFTEENGMRRDSKKRILLITDGMSNRGEPPVPIATQLHHQREVDVFPVGVGTNVNLREMNGMKLFHDKDSLLSKLLILPDFSSLDSVVDEVRTTARNKGRCQANLVR